LIPYFAQPSLPVGPITIHAFGLLVACGVLLGAKILQARAAAEAIPARAATRLVSWILIGGFLGAHLFDRIVYFPAETLGDPVSIFRIWEGLSSFGGFIGGTLGALLFFRRHATPGTAWKYVDAFAYAFPFGWVLGRLGCFVAFDHPGRPTHFVLGQVYKDGIVRHNLGLDEAIYTAFIIVLFHVLGRKPRFAGFYLGVFLLLYAPFRFGVDYLRIIDVRYGGLTPAQYGCIGLLLLGVAILAHRRAAYLVEHPRT